MAWFGTLLNSFGEVLAPSVHTPLEDFKNHWRSIRNFYIDGRHDIESFQISAIPEHLVSMITILSEEEREARNSLKDDIQPCLEFFMHNKIMETLCLLGERDKPKGIRKLVMQAITTLLTDVPHSLLTNVNVHQPLHNLLVSCIQAFPNIEKSECVQLLFTIVIQLRKQPYLIECFFRDTTSSNGVPIPEFTLFRGLFQHIKVEGIAAERAKEGILYCLEFDNPKAVDYIWNHSKFFDIAVTELTQCYEALPLVVNLQVPFDTPYQLYKKQAIYCSLIAHKLRRDAKEKFLAKIEDELLTSIVGPALLHVDEDVASSVTCYVRETLLFIGSPDILHLFITFLLGDFTKPETEEDEVEHVIRATILRRIDYPSEILSNATMKLLDALLSLCSKDVIWNLVLRTLVSGKHLQPGYVKPIPVTPSSSVMVLEEDSVRAVVASFLTLFPQGDAVGFAPAAYDAYLMDAQEQVAYIKETCAPWLPELPADAVPLTVDETKLEEEAYAIEYGGGMFLNLMWNKLDKMLEQPIDTNLIVTGIFTKLAQYPLPVLNSFLLDKNLPLRNGIRSLWGILSKLADQVEIESLSMADYHDRLRKVRDQMGSSVLVTRAEKDTMTQFFEGVIVLEEFCKELAATWQTFYLHRQQEHGILSRPPPPPSFDQSGSLFSPSKSTVIIEDEVPLDLSPEFDVSDLQ